MHPGSRDVALVSLPLPVLERDCAIGMKDARHHMFALLPDREPDRYFIKAAGKSAGHRLVLFERYERLAYATSIGGVTTKEPMVQLLSHLVAIDKAMALTRGSTPACPGEKTRAMSEEYTCSREEQGRFS